MFQYSLYISGISITINSLHLRSLFSAAFLARTVCRAVHSHRSLLSGPSGDPGKGGGRREGRGGEGQGRWREGWGKQIWQEGGRGGGT